MRQPVTTHRCLGCGPLPASAFGRDPRQRSGLKSRCRTCTSAQVKALRRSKGMAPKVERVLADGRVWCPGCENHLDRSLFSACPSRPHGVRPYCMACTRQNSRVYAEPLEKRRARNERNRTKLNEQRCARYWASKGVPTDPLPASALRPPETPEEREAREDLRAIYADLTALWLAREGVRSYHQHLFEARLLEPEDRDQRYVARTARRPAISIARHEGKRRRRAA